MVSVPLFSTNTVRSLDRRNVGHLLTRITQKAGVSNGHLHRFRHTFAVGFLRTGGDIFELQQILDHGSLVTVQVYVTLAQNDIEVAQKKASPADNWRL